MSTSSATLPPHVVDRARDYFAAFLGPQSSDEALADLAADAAFFDDHQLADVLANAHLILEERVAPPEHLEALVLHDDVGLSIDEVGRVMGLGHSQVRSRVDEALTAVGEEPRYDTSDGPRVVIVASEEEGPPRGFPEVATEDRGPSTDRRTLLVLGAFGAAIFLALLAWAATDPSDRGGSVAPPAEPQPCPSGADVVCLTDVALTTDVEAGRPGRTVEGFGLDDPVVLWFAYEPGSSAGAEPAAAEVRWYRDGDLLYPDPLRLDPTGWAQSTFAAGYQTEPGPHRVDVVIEGRVAASTSFEIERQAP